MRARRAPSQPSHPKAPARSLSLRKKEGTALSRKLKVNDGDIVIDVKDGVTLAAIQDQATGLASSYGVAVTELTDTPLLDVPVAVEETVQVEQTNVVLDGHVNIYSGTFTDD
ncbi:hypothetical protein SEA_MARAV_7 [Streptomyces phage Marav]|nr:hypothetical protein SEA_MARAV_7 [Streptomyces phage Marav]